MARLRLAACNELGGGNRGRLVGEQSLRLLSYRSIRLSEASIDGFRRFSKSFQPDSNAPGRVATALVRPGYAQDAGGAGESVSRGSGPDQRPSSAIAAGGFAIRKPGWDAVDRVQPRAGFSFLDPGARQVE